MYLLLRSLRVRYVCAVEQTLAVGHQVLLVQLPASFRRQGRLVVLHGGAELLLGTLFEPGTGTNPTKLFLHISKFFRFV